MIHYTYDYIGLKRTNYVRNIYPINTSFLLKSKRTVNGS